MNNSVNPLGVEKIGSLLKKFAIPSIVAMLVNSLYNIVDQIFIGQGVGFLGNAATNVAFPFCTICLALSLLIGIGAASKFSIELGKEKPEEASRCAGIAIDLLAICGVILFLVVRFFSAPMIKAFGATETVFPYAKKYVDIINIGFPLVMFTNAFSALIRSDGSPKYSMTCNIVGAVVNTILDPIFIFVFDMGVEGAAIATVISQAVSFIFALRYAWIFKRIELNKNSFKPDAALALNICSMGLSNCLTQVAITIVQVVINNSLTYWGAQSIYGADIPLSAAGIVMKVNGLIIAVYVGLSQGSQPIIGFNYGAKKYKRVTGVFKLALLWDLVMGAAATLLFQIFPEQVIGIFGSSKDPAMKELYMDFAVKYLRIFLALEIVIGAQIISSNFFASIGKPFKGAMLALCRQCFFIIPLVLILPRWMGLYGIMISEPISDLIAFIIGIAMVVHEFGHYKNSQE